MHKSTIKQAVHECWLREGGGTAADIELATRFSYHLRCIRNDTSKFSNVNCMKLNVRASPACYIRMHTQVTYMRKYHVKDWVHMNTTCIKRYEQEALSLFRTEVAPAFVAIKHSSARNDVNRFSRVCEFCKFVHGELYVNDVFHVLFKCPMVSHERISFFSTLDNTCAADEWLRADTLFDLGVSLLSPLSIEVACAVGIFLSEYLAAREILLASSPFSTPPKIVTSCRWLGGRSSKLDEMHTRISGMLHKRSTSLTPLPRNICVFSHVWITWHSAESLDDAFKPVRSWLDDGWEERLERKGKTSIRSIACL